MIVSTFELLINKSQFPKPKDLPDGFGLTPDQEKFLEDISREVIQGYFLTISNLTSVDVNLTISLPSRGHSI